MTTIIIDRAVVEQALEALEADCGGRCNAEYNPCWQREVAETLRAALARQAEPVAVDAAYQRWLEDTHAPALRRMDSQGAFAAGWQAALAQQAEPVQRSQDWHAGVLEGHLRERERWLAQQAEPVAVAERERIAAQWDGCVTHQLDTFGPVDIGASIRAGELVEPAQQVEPLINQCGETCERAKLCAVCASKLAEPVQMPAQEPYCHVYEYDSVFGLHRELYPREYNGRKPDRAVPLYTTPPQRLPLTEEEIDECFESVMFNPDIEPTRELIARAIEAAHGIKEGT